MKSKIFVFTTFMMVMLCSMCLVSCGDDDDNSADEVTQEEISPKDQEIIDKLSGTSWKAYKKVGHGSTDYFTQEIITFAQKGIFYVVNPIPGKDVSRYVGSWEVKDEIIHTFMSSDALPPIDRGWLIGGLKLFLPWKIITLSNSELIIEENSDLLYFTRTSYTEGSSSGGGSNSGSMYFVNFTFSATQSSVTVKFNTSERPSRATIKYGKSSASTTVSGVDITNKQISATITGLSKGTKYYVKCTAYYDGGSITSDEYPVITNY